MELGDNVSEICEIGVTSSSHWPSSVADDVAIAAASAIIDEQALNRLFRANTHSQLRLSEPIALS